MDLHLRVSLAEDDFLARPDETRALLTYAVERSLQLLLSLDAVGEVAPNTNAHHALTVDEAPQLRHGSAQAPLARVAIRTKLRNGH